MDSNGNTQTSFPAAERGAGYLLEHDPCHYLEFYTNIATQLDYCNVIHVAYAEAIPHHHPIVTAFDHPSTNQVVIYPENTTHPSFEVTDCADEESTRSIIRVDNRNLAEIGIAITETLQKWGHQPATTIQIAYSLDSLFDQPSTKPTYQFLQILLNQLRQDGAIAFFHIDTTNVSDSSLQMITELFDDAVFTDTANEISDIVTPFLDNR